MTALEYARKHVYFWQNSPVMGVFDERKYPFIIAPLASLSDVGIKTLLLYGPTQSFKTVYLQIAMAYLLDVRRKSVLATAQTDDDADDFSAIKVRPFLERIPSLKDTVKKGPHAITNTAWKWATHELLLSGPGLAAQQSKSVAYWLSDESHMYPAGAMAALDNRMGLRWDRLGLHVTTAAEQGTEADILYHKGSQNEWNLRCIHCNGLFQPLWKETSRETYNGHEVFRYYESQSENETLDSIRIHCPFCDKITKDHPRSRAEMDEGADYIAANKSADTQFQSYRWNAFAPRWKPWRDLLSIYLKAIHSAKLGDLAPYADWITKQEVRTNRHEYPMLGDSSQGRDYDTADIEVISESLRVCSFDVQESGGFHIWGLVDQFRRDGSSQRVSYRQLSSWADARKFQQDHGVKDRHTACDFGHRDREVFGRCAEWHWFALKSTDEDSFSHVKMDNTTHETFSISLPYSSTRIENPLSGHKQITVFRKGVVPRGLCASRLWSKPAIYPVLYAHKNGSAGRYYGVARNIGDEFTNQLHSYIPTIELDKKTNSPRRMIWKQVRTDDHAFCCAAQNLILALIAGYFPMSETKQEAA